MSYDNLDSAYQWPYCGDGYPLYEDDPDWRKCKSRMRNPTVSIIDNQQEKKYYTILTIAFFLLIFLFYIR